MSFITTSSLAFLVAFLTQNLLTLKLNKIEYTTCSLIQEQVVKNQLFHQFDRRLIVTKVVLSLKLSSVQWSESYISKTSQVDLLRKVENRYHMCNV